MLLNRSKYLLITYLLCFLLLGLAHAAPSNSTAASSPKPAPNSIAANSLAVNVTPSNPVSDLSITGISLSPYNVLQGSPVYLWLNLSNNGQLADTNVTALINVTGDHAAISYNLASLSPQQSENVLIITKNLTQTAGLHQLNATLWYFTNQIIRDANGAAASYNVISSNAAFNNQSAISVVPAQFSVTSLPVYTSMGYGSSQLSNINFMDNSSFAENLSLSIPQQFSSIVSTSATTLVLSPGRSLTATLHFSAPSGVAAGTYVIPLKISTLFRARKELQAIEPLTVTIVPTGSTPTILEQITLLNATAASGVVQLDNPTSLAFNNTLVQSFIPANLTTNSMQVTAYGIDNRLIKTANSLSINWYAGQLPAMQSYYGYYTITNLTNTLPLTSIQHLLTLQSPQLSNSVLRMASTASGTLHTDGSIRLNLSVLYTGVVPQPLTLVITAPHGIALNNTVSTFQAVPNQAIKQSYSLVADGEAGTFLLTVYASAGHSNIVYYLPVVVYQSANAPMPANGIAPQHPPKPNDAYLIFSLIIVIGALVGFIVRVLKPKGPSYNQADAARMARMRHQIRSSGDTRIPRPPSPR